MSRLLVLCALIGAALAVPTPNTLPKSVLGTFENIPSESKNFEEFVTVFGLPKHAKFDKQNLIGFWKEGDTYYQRFVYWPTSLTFDLPFKLGETQTITVLGKQLEYVYTMETGETPETPVLRAKFRQVDGDVKFTVEAVFNKDGRITATYARDNIVAKRTYRRTLPPYVLGAFESDESRVSDESVEFFNTAYPLPGGIKWTKNTKFWLGRDPTSDYFVDKLIASPEYYIGLKFKLDEPANLKIGTETIKATYTVLETNTNKTTLRSEMTTSKGQMTTTTVFDRQGATCTIKTADKEFTSYYKRVLPWLFYGTFEEVPEKSENWDEFMKGDEGCKIANGTKGFRIYRKSDGEYAVSKTVAGKKFEVPFKLGAPSEITLPNGKQMKYNTTLLNGNSTYLIVRSTIGDKKITMEEKVKACGLAVTYRRHDGVEGKKYFRRVIPKTVMGTFESPEFTGDEQLKKFATAHHAENLLKKSSIEFTETPDHKYHKKMTVEGEEPEDVTFTLGEPMPYTCKKTGKTMKVVTMYHEANNKPTLVTAVYGAEKKPLMRMTKIFTAEGFEATLVYDIENGEKISKRTYTRKGAAVPFELPTSA